MFVKRFVQAKCEMKLEFMSLRPQKRAIQSNVVIVISERRKKNVEKNRQLNVKES